MKRMNDSRYGIPPAAYTLNNKEATIEEVIDAFKKKFQLSRDKR